MNPVRQINHIIVIQSLPNGDVMTGKELYDDVIKRHIDLKEGENKITHKFFDVKNKATLVDILKYIAANSRYMPGAILIHFEMHGSAKKDGLVLADLSLISWKELVELFRPINIATCNKLFITMATCFGRHLYEGVNPTEKSPYQAFISASKEVKVSEVMEKFNLLFEILIESGDLIHAYLEHEKTGTNFYYKDSLSSFEDSIALFISNLGSDPATLERIIDQPDLKRELDNGNISNAQLAEMLTMAFKQNYEKHKAAFNFTDCV